MTTPPEMLPSKSSTPAISTTETLTPEDTRRRERLRRVLVPLATLSEFTRNEAKERCSESSPGFVTTTIRHLVSEQWLQPVEIDGAETFRWNSPESFQIDAFIDGLVHGTQVKQTPVEERPREKLARVGAANLSNAELLALLIRSGVRGESAITGGNRLAGRLEGRLDKLPDLTCEEVRGITKAVNVANYAQIMAGIELGRRVAAIRDAAPSVTVQITSTTEAVEDCQRTFARLAIDGVQEEFHIVTLDTKHKPIASHLITRGTLDASLVHPREVFRPAIRDSAAAVLLVHNHPSGDPTPSREDHQVTDHLSEAGKLLGITVLDHVVVAKQRCVSIRECG